MARTARRPAPLPPPLPPAERTIGQLIAETIRFYGSHFWRSLGLGVAPAALAVGTTFLGRWGQFALAAVGGGVLISLAYVAACRLVAGSQARGRTLARAWVVALLVWLPVPFLALGLFVPALAWLALIGLAVPAAVIEDRPIRAALGRGLQLGRVDYKHSVFSLAALVVVVGATGLLLSLLIHTGSDQAARVALFLGNLIVSPLLFLGAALLYDDQAARLDAQAVISVPHHGGGRDAEVRDADDADREGRADAPVEPRPAEGGQP